jgi:hypothetical protein
MAALQEMRALLRQRSVQIAALGLLLAFILWRSMLLKFSVLDLDVWWHLRVGDWIMAHHAFPHNGILSRTAADRPWAAYSWGYEVLLSNAYHWFNLVGMGIYGTLLTLGVTYSMFAMARRLSGRFWVAWLVTAASAAAFLFNIMPRPVFFSMMFFCLLLTLLFEAERTGNIRLLYWLPLLFLVWANVHIQFVYGLSVMALFAGASLLAHLSRRFNWEPEWLLSSTLPILPLLAILLVCALAACVGPYSYHVYQVVYGYIHAQFPYRAVRELQAINFRAYSHFAQLLVTGFAFFALGRQRRISLFQVFLLTATSIVAYRTLRDSWFACISAAACLAAAFWRGGEQDRGESWAESIALAAGLAVCMLLFARNTDFNQEGLDGAISHQFPVKAVNFLRQNPQPGPLYNTFDWGGFLTWYMPDYPVAVDGRTDLYGDELEDRFFKTANGEESYVNDPYLNEAGVILLQKDAPLAAVLSIDQRFEKIYEDRVAVIYIPRRSSELPHLPLPFMPQP